MRESEEYPNAGVRESERCNAIVKKELIRWERGVGDQTAQTQRSQDAEKSQTPEVLLRTSS